MPERYRLDGKAAIVTAAAHGIGKATAIAYGAAGARVVCSDIDKGAVEATAQAIREAGGDAIAIAGDVAQLDQMQALAGQAVEAYGGVQVLLFGAAVQDAAASVVDLEPEVWNQVLSVNLTGAYHVTKAVLPAMIASGGGSVILIASQLGSVAMPGRAAYCATKGALIQMAKVLAADHAAENIRVNTLSPGAVETDRLLRRFNSMEAARADMGPRHLLERLGQPEEIAQAALFLASDAASFMTGADLLVDGGYTAV